MDQTLESVRWCRQHLQERGVSEKLRELQITLAALALALECEMEGNSWKANRALNHAEWRTLRFSNPHVDDIDCG
jgi:hypothetical protein